ncbi:MAG TPA: hypothetical protein VGD37_06850 [Kofleriaceae bacterium]|jgi:hypothetical protein
MQKRTLFGLVVVVLAVLVIVRLRSDVPPPSHRGRSASPAGATHGGSPASTAPGSGSAGAPARPGEAQPLVRRLTGDERRRLGEQIAASRQRARAAAAGAANDDLIPVNDDQIPVENVGKPLKDGLTAAIPLLAACYEQQPGGNALREAAAQMTMTSDPELGTVVDTEGITDAAGKPLAARLDDCLRDTIDSLALPPLGATGGRVKLTYTFRFD